MHRNGFIREEEIKAVSTQLGKFLDVDGTVLAEQYAREFMGDTNYDDMTSKLGNFTFKSFDSKNNLEEYIASDKVGFDEDFEPICFAFAIHENDNRNKYELELFYNDLRPDWMQAIPNQKQPVWSSYEYAPKVKAYNEYQNSGFGHMQNWVANTILKRSTGV